MWSAMVVEAIQIMWEIDRCMSLILSFSFSSSFSFKDISSLLRECCFTHSFKPFAEVFEYLHVVISLFRITLWFVHLAMDACFVAPVAIILKLGVVGCNCLAYFGYLSCMDCECPGSKGGSVIFGWHVGEGWLSSVVCVKKYCCFSHGYDEVERVCGCFWEDGIA